MQRLTVELSEPTDEGRLYPWYALDVDILALESTMRRSWPYGVDIDGTVIFDADETGLVGTVELMISRDRWRIVDNFELPPLPVPRRADLRFTKETIEEQSFRLPLEVTTNVGRTACLFVFGEPAKRLEADVCVELSDRCYSLVHEGNLNGFYVALDDLDFSVEPPAWARQ